MYGKSTILGDFYLTFLDLGIVKFLDPAALQAYQMVVVRGARRAQKLLFHLQNGGAQAVQLVRTG